MKTLEQVAHDIFHHIASLRQDAMDLLLRRTYYLIIIEPMQIRMSKLVWNDFESSLRFVRRALTPLSPVTGTPARLSVNLVYQYILNQCRETDLQARWADSR